MEYSFRNLPLSDIIEQAQQKDELYISKFARIKSDGEILRRFKIIPHEDLKKDGRFRIIVDDKKNETEDISIIQPQNNDKEDEQYTKKTRSTKKTSPIEESSKLSHKKKGKSKNIIEIEEDNGEASSKSSHKKKGKAKKVIEIEEDDDDEKEEEEEEEIEYNEEKDKQEDSSPPQLLECNLYGELTFLEAGEYGNWIPSDVNDYEGPRYPQADPEKAAIVIGMKVDPAISESLDIIDNTMRTYLEQRNKPVVTYYKLAPKDRVILRYPLLVKQLDWTIRNEQLKEQDEEYKDEPPEFSDPEGWFAKYAKGYINDDDHYISILHVDRSEKGYKKISRKNLSKGDIVQAKVSFDPYLSSNKTAGIKLNLEELMVIRGYGEIVSIKTSKKRAGDKLVSPPKKTARRV